MLPFVIKGVRDANKNNAKYSFSKGVRYVHSDDFLVCPTDYNIVSKAVLLSDIKQQLFHEFGYEYTDTVFKIQSFEDNSVQYTRPDGSGFVRKSGSRTWRNQNPGAIRTSPFTRKMGAIGDAGGFAVFPSEEQGMIALKALLRTESYSKLSIYDAIHKYAPFCDSNDPIRYQRHLYESTGIKPNRKLSDLSDEELEKIAQSIKVLEGWKEGTVSNFGLFVDLINEICTTQKQRNS